MYGGWAIATWYQVIGAAYWDLPMDTCICARCKQYRDALFYAEAELCEEGRDWLGREAVANGVVA